MLAPLTAAPENPPLSPGAAPPASVSLFRGLHVVGTLTLLSRVLGLVRDIGMAGLFGLGPVMDAFTIAFRIPNLARRLFGEGALSATFVPLFARELEHADRASAWQLASAVFSLLTVALTGAVLVGEVGLIIAGRLLDLEPDTQLLLCLTAIMLPYLVLICLASQVSAVLNVLGNFTWPAAAPVVLNVVWIAGVWWLAPLFSPPDSQARILAGSIVLAGLLQVGVQGPALWRFGFRFTPGWRAAWPRVWEMLQALVPIVLGLSITQVNTVVDSLIAWGFSQPFGAPEARLSWLGSVAYPMQAGAVSALYYGERMYQFPLGVFGVTLGTVLFPLLARHAARGEMDRLRQDLTLGLKLVIAIGVPASASLVYLAQPISVALLEHGAFQAADTLRAAGTTAVYGSGVWAYCGLLILQRGFYAVGDRMTPLRIGVLAVGLNFVLNLLLIWPLAEQGLALSTVLCATLQVVALVWCLQQRIGRLAWKEIGGSACRTLGATAAMSAAGMSVLAWQATFPPLAGRLAMLLLPCAVSVLTFLIAAKVMRLDEFWLLFRRGRNQEQD